MVIIFIGYHLVMTNIAMENRHAIKNGKPSISMGHLYHGELLVITRGSQRVLVPLHSLLGSPMNSSLPTADGLSRRSRPRRSSRSRDLSWKNVMAASWEVPREGRNPHEIHIFQAYVREYPQKNYGQKYGTSTVPPCIGSWNSHWLPVFWTFGTHLEYPSNFRAS